MTDFQKVLTDMPLDAGGHEPGTGACVMEKVAILWALHTGQDVAAVWSDLPECTNEVVAEVARYVNDHLTNTQRQKLNALIPRLLRARRTDSDRRVNVRLAVWSARRVLYLVTEDLRPAAEAAVRDAEAWLENPSESTALQVRTAAACSANSAACAACAACSAACAACSAARAAARAANSAACAAAACDAETRLAFLDGLLDAWEEAVTKEGEDLYVPREWEDEALAFVDEFMGES